MSEIRDINLWESGEKKMAWAKRYMPLLNGIEAEFLRDKPFEGLKVSVCLHLEAKSAVLCRVIAAGGAEVRVCGSNPLSTQDDVCAALHGPLLLLVADAVVAAIDSHAADVVQVVGEALHGAVYLLREFAGWRHDDAVDGILGIIIVIKHGKDGQQIGGGLSRTCLSHSKHIVAIENLRDTTFLNRRHLFEAHIVERIENIIV